MANLTFSDLQNEVYAQTGLDGTQTINQTNVSRWLNFTQQDICSRWPWPFMESREAIATVEDHQDGTIIVSPGSTTVTGSGTNFTSTMANGQYFIQFEGSNDWYKIATFNTGASIDMEQAFVGPTVLTDSPYIIRKFFYSLSSSCDRIIDIRNWETPIKLIYADPRTLDDLRPNPQSTNSSYGYLCWGYDTSGNIQVSPYPFPSDNRVLELRTIKRPTDSAVSIPNKYAILIAWGAIAVGFGYLKQLDLAAPWNSKYEMKLDEMKKEFRMSEDTQPIMRSIDSVQRAKWIQMPEQYPAITS